MVLWPGRAGTECHVTDISLGGAKLHGSSGLKQGMTTGTLLLDDGRQPVPFQVLRSANTDLMVLFEGRSPVRRTLIGRLFGGDYSPELDRVRMFPVL